MADDKLNTSPEEDKSLGPAAPQGLGDPPSPEPVKSPSNSPKHEQAVIPGMGEDAPALSGKVINLSDIQAADKGGKEVSAPAPDKKAPEADKPPKRRGRPPKGQAGPPTEK